MMITINKGVFRGRVHPPMAIRLSPRNILLDVAMVILNFICLIGMFSHHKSYI